MTTANEGKLLSLPILVGAVLAYCLIAWLNVQVTFPLVQRYFGGSPFLSLLGAYLPHAISLLLIGLPLALLQGMTAIRESGFTIRKALIAIPAVVLFWIVVNTYAFVTGMQENGDWLYSQKLEKVPWWVLVVQCLVTQVAGNALLEEWFFRGILFRQLKRRAELGWLRRFKSKSRVCLAVLFAVAISVPVFAAIHVPVRLHNGVTGDALMANLIRVGIWGFVFTMLYVSSQNLWLVIGIHSITNRRCLLFEPGVSIRTFELYLCLFAIAACFLIGWIRRRRHAANDGLSRAVIGVDRNGSRLGLGERSS